MKDLFGNKLEKSAVFSLDRVYRAVLTRRWASSKSCNFLMLNPSIADENVEDPTIRRCIDFASREGCGSLIVTNLYALRSTDPAGLWRHPQPTGDQAQAWVKNEGGREEKQPTRGNYDWIIDAAIACEVVICAWGSHGAQNGRGDFIARKLREQGVKLFCLGKNQDGTPEHPLYIAKDRPLVAF